MTASLALPDLTSSAAALPPAIAGSPGSAAGGPAVGGFEQVLAAKLRTPEGPPSSSQGAPSALGAHPDASLPGELLVGLAGKALPQNGMSLPAAAGDGLRAGPAGAPENNPDMATASDAMSFALFGPVPAVPMQTVPAARPGQAPAGNAQLVEDAALWPRLPLAEGSAAELSEAGVDAGTALGARAGEARPGHLPGGLEHLRPGPPDTRFEAAFERPLVAALSGQAAGEGEGGRLAERELALPHTFGHPRWGEGLGERVRWMVRNDLQRAELRLDPPELGPLGVRIAVQGEEARVHFMAAHGLTREAVEAALPRLREMLAESGVQLVHVDVSGHWGAAAGGGGSGTATPEGAAQSFPPAFGTADESPWPAVARAREGLLDEYA